jgi:glycyl-tRNA synthetase
MVEQPTAFLGRFDPEHLEVPTPVLTTVMMKQQRYFPVRDASGALLPAFVGVRNGGGEHLDEVAAGNEAVIRARFADARYFYDQDRRQSLEEWLPRLETLTFQEHLGSFLDKTRRLEGLVADLSDRTGLCAEGQEREDLMRAARLAKADMVTRVVTEFPYLAGIMGGEYGRLQGEREAVVRAIEEQYLPLPGKTEPPRTPAGLLLSMADRLDKLMGLFALGLRPSGAADPYALRRDGLGLLVCLLESCTEMSIHEALALAAERLPVEVKAGDLEEAFEFLTRRLSGLLAPRCDRPDLVAAAVRASGDNPVRCARGLEVLAARARRDDWPALLMAYARCARLARAEGASPSELDHSALSDPVEMLLADAATDAARLVTTLNELDEIFDALQDLVDPINMFFDKVMVMVDDESLRRSRLGILATVDSLLVGWVDLSQVEGF